MLHNAIFSQWLEKETHCKFQETCYTLQCRAVTCNGLKKSLQSLQEVELSSTQSTASVTQCKFLCNLHSNGIVTQVAGRFQREACPLCNLPCNFLTSQRLHKAEPSYTFCNDCMDSSKPLQVAARDGSM